MKKALLVVLLVLSIGTALAQQTPVPRPIPLPYSAGQYFAPAFGQWSVPLASAISATGSQAFTVTAGTALTPSGGIRFVPFVVGEKILVGAGSLAEVVQISAVTGCTAQATPAVSPVCTITATSFSNAHSIGDPVSSSDSGIMEAVGYAAASGGAPVRFLVDCGIVTLNTGNATTTTTCYVPATFIQAGSGSRVTTTITTATNWAVGISGSTASFSTANSTLTAGTTSIANQPAGTLVGTSAGLGAVLVTTTGSQTDAGKVHLVVWGVTPGQANY